MQKATKKVQKKKSKTGIPRRKNGTRKTFQNFFGRFLHLQFFVFQLLEPKPTSVFETSHHFLRFLKQKKLLIFENVFAIFLCFTSLLYSILVSPMFLLLLRLKEYLFFERFFSVDLPFFSVSSFFFLFFFFFFPCSIFCVFFVNLPFRSLRYV